MSTHHWMQAQKLPCWLRVNLNQLPMKCIPLCYLHLQELWCGHFRPEKKHIQGKTIIISILFSCPVINLNWAFSTPYPLCNLPLHTLVSPYFSPVFLLMLRGLWTAASIFTLSSVASRRATQIFIGTRPQLEYWWTLLCTLWTGADVSSWARPGPGIQYVDCVMALAVKIVIELPVEWVMSFHCSMWWILLQGASKAFFYFHEGHLRGLSCSLSL